MKIRRGRKWILTMLCILIGAGIVFFVVAYIQEYRPQKVENLPIQGGENSKNSSERAVLPDTLTLVSWNIGYAGLGDNMDFFYDGGKRVRDTKIRTEQNLKHIIEVLMHLDADIILLQEVDRDSHRTYGIDELQALASVWPDRYTCFAFNYDAFFVPIPLKNPIGRVKSGMAVISKVKPIEAVRYQYPSQFGFPSRLFNLKRGLLSLRFMDAHGEAVYVNNTHNTAYDEGGMRSSEMNFLSELIRTWDAAGVVSVTGGDWNQFPPSYQPKSQELQNDFFTPQKIDSAQFADLGTFVYDSLTPSLRYLDKPLQEKPATTLTDFFFVSKGVRVLELRTVETGFVPSDHQPVVMRVTLR